MSCGHPVAVLGRCKQFWQGDSGAIWPLKKSDRNAVLEMYERWTREGFDCRTCAYTPCVPEMSSELRSLQEKVKQNVTKKKRLERHKQGSVCTNIDADKLVSLGMDNISFYLTMTENEIKAAFASAVYTSESLVKEKRYGSKRENVTTTADYTPTEAFDQDYMLSRQIFLGMLASRPQPKEEMVGVIEDLDKAGIRFVYFSPRNPKRAKIMASQMGLEVGWNSSVSLVKDFKDSGWTPDQWDTRAKLPHGVQEIREHIKNVDNVPLLVSLYTDSKPKATKEMLQIFKENKEIICVFGSALRASNSSLFQGADVAFGVDFIEQTEGHVGRETFNRSTAGKSGVSADVILPNNRLLSLSGRLNTLSCAMTLPWEGSTYALVDLIGLCRKFLKTKSSHCIIFSF